MIEDEFDAMMEEDLIDEKKRFCIWCSNEVKKRGFCSEKCHNDYYDATGDVKEEEIITNIIGHAQNIIDWIDNAEWHPAKAHAKDIIVWANKLKGKE